MENEKEIIVEEEALMKQTDWDAIGLRFRLGEDDEKRFKIVHPKKKEVLLYGILTGETPDDLKLETFTQEEVDAMSSEPKGEELVLDEDAAITADSASPETIEETGPMDAEDLEQAAEEEENMEAMDNVLDDLGADKPEEGPDDGKPDQEAPEEEIADTDEETEEIDSEGEIEEEIDEVVEEDSNVAGYLIAVDETAQPNFIIVRAMDDESDSDAVDRVLNDHDGFRVGSYDEVKKLVGHDPLSAEDN